MSQKWYLVVRRPLGEFPRFGGGFGRIASLVLVHNYACSHCNNYSLAVSAKPVSTSHCW